MILEEVKIQSKMRASVSASLCGIPRIKPLVHMEIWSNEELMTVHCCKVIVDDRRLIRGNRIMLNIINTSDVDVVLPPRTLVAFAKVNVVGETTLRAKPLNPVKALYFLKHYYETCDMTDIKDSHDEDCFRFGHGHEIRLRKKAKVNFEIYVGAGIKDVTIILI